MALKLATLALVAGITLAGFATAQTDPNARPQRQMLPPGTPTTTQELQRVCAWRSDGGTVTGRFMRAGPGVTMSYCSVNRSRPLGASCRCGNRGGNVIDIPV